ncbi:MAG: hypothetical protein IPL46_24500 [Saprospiraceae bacterium]|nr:hypothetical protein [Saprospiraceae bacterium]
MARIDQLHRKIATGLIHFDLSMLLSAISMATDKLRKKNIDVFKNGNLDAWAAILIYVIADQDNLEQNAENGVTLEGILDFYNLETEEVLSLVDQVKRDLDLDEENENCPEFESADQEDSLINIESDEVNGVSEWLTVGVEFKYRTRIDRITGLQLEELTRTLLLEVNRDHHDPDCLTISSIKIKERQIKIQLTGYEADIDCFCDLMEGKRIVFVDWIILESEENLFTPDAHYAMFMEQFESMDLDGQEFESTDEIQVKLHQFVNRSPVEIKSQKPKDPEGTAIVDAIKAFKMRKNASITKVRQILNKQPNCTEAHICLAGWEEDQSKRIDMLEHALDLAEDSLDLEECDKHQLWWRYHRTRPYMRAMRLLAHELYNSGDEDGSRDLLWELIEMNEGDNQGNRLILLELCAVKKRWFEVRKLLAKYPEDQSLTFVYGRAIYLYYTQGNKSKTKKALIKAYQRNRHPLRLMSGVAAYPEIQPYFKLGDKNEATEVIPLLSSCFEKTKS